MSKRAFEKRLKRLSKRVANIARFNVRRMGGDDAARRRFASYVKNGNAVRLPNIGPKVLGQLKWAFVPGIVMIRDIFTRAQHNLDKEFSLVDSLKRKWQPLVGLEKSCKR